MTPEREAAISIVATIKGGQWNSGDFEEIIRALLASRDAEHSKAILACQVRALAQEERVALLTSLAIELRMYVPDGAPVLKMFLAALAEPKEPQA